MGELPAWVRKTKPGQKKTKDIRSAVTDLRKALEKKKVGRALADALQARKAASRLLAVACFEALDDLPALLAALEEGCDRDVRLAAVGALHFWVSRGAEYPARLYQALQKKKYSRGQAAIFMQLLFGFSAAQLAQPETYALLIEYLKHNRLAIRELAVRQLELQVPDGRSIGYDPAGKPAQRARGYAAWKKRIPDGELPKEPKPKKKEEKN